MKALDPSKQAVVHWRCSVCTALADTDKQPCAVCENIFGIICKCFVPVLFMPEANDLKPVVYVFVEEPNPTTPHHA